MYDPTITFTAVIHAIAGHLRAAGVLGPNDDELSDRGAVSLEQALWYAAAAVAVAVVAAIIWAQIRSTASTPVDVPDAP
ncbi:MAG: hypothetical protein AAFP84_16450 [Actinomycetota bacterium]